MLAVLLVTSLESYLNSKGAGHSHAHNVWEDESGEHDHGPSPSGYNRMVDENIPLQDIEASGLVANASPLPGSTPTIAPRGGMTLQVNGPGSKTSRDSIDDLAFELDDTVNNASQPLTGNGNAKSTNLDEPSRPVDHRRLQNQVFLLEGGILAHSVFIGMAVSVATGAPFWAFLFAICFHQMFEGLALGTRIATIDFGRGSWKPYLMILAFGATTPLGQAIGIIVHRLYDPQSAFGLLTVGLTNAISSGLLLFAALTQLLAEDFLSAHSYQVLTGRKRTQAFVALWAGAVLMALVGAFA